ncbi:Nitrogen permease regulator 2 [Mortierella sp. GBA30]|nr:Nitrogen permease regulator 2 [Mortierella sp. GBA30]
MGFPRLLSIFYCTFHPTQGPKVLYEVPEGSILSKSSPLVDFDSISEYLIPKVELCSKLVTISTPTCKVIGFPINLEHKKFQRNALMFNLAFVFDKDAEITSYEPVVRKMARVLKALEKESEFLSRQTRIAMMDSGAQPSSVLASVVPAVSGNTTVATTITGSTGPPSTAASPATSNSSSAAAADTSHICGGGSGTATLETVTGIVPGVSLGEASVNGFVQGQIQGANGVASSPLTSTSNASAAPMETPSTQTPCHRDRLDGSSIIISFSDKISNVVKRYDKTNSRNIIWNSANTINLKLFPTYPNPAPVYDYQVPISTVNLEALTDVNWDMTMQRITGYINGVNSVKRIAEYADVETGLARMCMEHLLYYGCIIMVDLFQFKNIYAVKMEMMRLTEDVALQHECVQYVTLPDMHAPSFAKIFSLYCSLQYGVVLQDWIEQNQISDYNIDVRRFISFGVIKGFLYRVHKYPILDYYDPALVNTGITAASGTSSKPDAQASTTGMSTSLPQPAPAPVTAAMTPSAATTATTAVTSRSDTPSALTSMQKKVYGDSLAPTDQHPHNPSHYSNQQHHQHQQQQNPNEHASSSVIIPPALRK